MISLLVTYLCKQFGDDGTLQTLMLASGKAKVNFSVVRGNGELHAVLRSS